MQSELFKLFKVKEQIKQNNCFLSVPGVLLRAGDAEMNRMECVSLNSPQASGEADIYVTVTSRGGTS